MINKTHGQQCLDAIRDDFNWVLLGMFQCATPKKNAEKAVVEAPLANFFSMTCLLHSIRRD